MLPENVTTSYTIKPKDITVTITPNGGTYGEKITGATAKLILYSILNQLF